MEIAIIMVCVMGCLAITIAHSLNIDRLIYSTIITVEPESFPPRHFIFTRTYFNIL